MQNNSFFAHLLAIGFFLLKSRFNKQLNTPDEQMFLTIFFSVQHYKIHLFLKRIICINNTARRKYEFASFGLYLLIGIINSMQLSAGNRQISIKPDPRFSHAFHEPPAIRPVFEGT